MVRNPGRLLAPIAIIAVAVALLLILRGNLGSHHTVVAHTTAAPVRARHRQVRAAPRRPRFYTVRSGDTLSAIASRTHVALTRLEALNPSLAPAYTLHTGQRLRLPR